MWHPGVTLSLNASSHRQPFSLIHGAHFACVFAMTATSDSVVDFTAASAAVRTAIDRHATMAASSLGEVCRLAEILTAVQPNGTQLQSMRIFGDAYLRTRDRAVGSLVDGTLSDFIQVLDTLETAGPPSQAGAIATFTTEVEDWAMKALDLLRPLHIADAEPYIAGEKELAEWRSRREFLDRRLDSLEAAIARQVSAEAHLAAAAPPQDISPRPFDPTKVLEDEHKMVLRSLDGKRRRMKQLASEWDVSNETVRQYIKACRDLGLKIGGGKGKPYYRPDSAPNADGSDAPPRDYGRDRALVT